MELIRTLSQMVNCLRSRGIRRKVAVSARTTRTRNMSLSVA